MTKKGIIIISIIIILIISFICIYNYNINEKAQKNYCIRLLINEDYIAKGCDKYFLQDKFYNNFINEMYKEYKKIK